MFGITGRKTVVPVIPGPDGATAGGSCDACGKGGRFEPLGSDGLCIDFRACIARYRSRASPDSYAAGLRGEILAVAP